MSTQPTQEGLWAAWGIDTRSPEEMLSQRVQEQIKAGMAEPLGGDTAGARATKRGGQALGSVFRGWLTKKKGLSPAEQQQVDIRADTDSAWQKFAETDQFKSMDSEEKSHQYQIFMAESAFKNGQGGLGASIYKQAWEQKRARTVSDKNLEMLDHNLTGAGLDNESKRIGIDGKVIANEGSRLDNKSKRLGHVSAEQQIEQNDRALARDSIYGDVNAQSESRQKDAAATNAERTGVKTIYGVGEQNPNAGMTAYIRQDGKAILSDGSIMEGTEFTTDRPEAPTAPTATKSRYSSGGLSGSVEDKYRKQLTSNLQEVKSINATLDTLAKTKGDVNFLGGSGAAISSFRKISETIQGLFREAGGKDLFNTKMFGDDGKQIGTMQLAPDGTLREKSVKEFGKRNPEVMEAIANWAKVAGEDRDVYAAQLMGMAIARARSVEPDANALSEGDIKRAIMEVGGTAGSVEGLRRISQTRLAALESSVTGTLQSLPNGAMDNAMSSSFWNNLGAAFKRGRTLTGGPAGTNENPEGLRNAAVEAGEEVGGDAIQQLQTMGYLKGEPPTKGAGVAPAPKEQPATTGWQSQEELDAFLGGMGGLR